MIRRTRRRVSTVRPAKVRIGLIEMQGNAEREDFSRKPRQLRGVQQNGRRRRELSSRRFSFQFEPARYVPFRIERIVLGFLLSRLPSCTRDVRPADAIQKTRGW